MKRLAILLLALLVASCAKPSPLSGRWKGEDASGHEVVLFLETDGGFEAISNGERLAGTWSVDEAAEPDRLDLVFEGRTLSSIIKLQGDNLLIESVGADGKLPTKFDHATFYKRQQ
jgi:hypothetical protein